MFYRALVPVLQAERRGGGPGFGPNQAWASGCRDHAECSNSQRVQIRFRAHSGSDDLDNGYALSLNLAIWSEPKYSVLSYQDMKTFME